MKLFNSTAVASWALVLFLLVPLAANAAGIRGVKRRRTQSALLGRPSASNPTSRCEDELSLVLSCSTGDCKDPIVIPEDPIMYSNFTVTVQAKTQSKEWALQKITWASNAYTMPSYYELPFLLQNNATLPTVSFGTPFVTSHRSQWNAKEGGLFILAVATLFDNAVNRTCSVDAMFSSSQTVAVTKRLPGLGDFP